MIMGAAFSTVFFNLKLKHPTLDIPIIDYDLVLLIQPMLMLGISIGVVLSVMFANWMVTVLLIILCLGKTNRRLLLKLPLNFHIEIWLICYAETCRDINQGILQGC